MKRFTFSLLLVGIIFLASCSKECTEGTIYRDCTGTYLKVNDLYYNIVNRNSVDAIGDNETVRVAFEHEDEPGPGSVCLMVSVYNSGYIRIQSVN